MKRHDELAVSERQLQQPHRPEPMSLSAFLKTSAKCKIHNNPMSGGRLECRAFPGINGVAVAGEIRLSFVGCKCREIRPLK